MNLMAKSERISWRERFVLSHLGADRAKNILVFVSALISFTAVLLAVGFSEGSRDTIEDNQTRLLDYQRFTATKKEHVAMASTSISLIRTSRPEMTELLFFKRYVPSLKVSLSYERIFPGDYRLSINEKKLDGVSLLPIMDFESLDVNRRLAIAGEIPISDNSIDVVINTNLARVVDQDFPSLIGREIALEIESRIAVRQGDSTTALISDVFICNRNLRIAAVIEEFSFLNVPKIFYSHRAVEEMMKSYELSEISRAKGVRTTCHDVVAMANANEAASNYSLNLFVDDFSDVAKMNAIIDAISVNDSGLSIDSAARAIAKTYSELMGAALYSMMIFVAISFLGANFILGISAFSNFISKRKESAIMTCLGARGSDIMRIFLGESLRLSCGAAALAMALAYLLGSAVNAYVDDRYQLADVIAIPYARYLGFPFGIVLLVMAISIISASIFTLVPLTYYKHFSLIEELRDE